MGVYPFLLLALAFPFLGCATQPETSLSREIQEIRPGIVQGYLAEDELPSSLAWLPPPPEEGSVAFELDQEMAAEYVALDGEGRRAQAVRDNVLAFPELSDAILERGREFGISRRVCNVHWYRDVAAGWTLSWR